MVEEVKEVDASARENMPHSDESGCPGLERGQIIPAFTLPGSDGMPHSPWDYKQRQHLLLLFLPSSTDSASRITLQTFAQHYANFREEMCAIMALTADPVITNLQQQEALHLPFPLLSDPQGNVLARYTRWNSTAHSFAPGCVLADRYNALYEQWIVGDREELPSITAVLESLQYLNRLCTP